MANAPSASYSNISYIIAESRRHILQQSLRQLVSGLLLWSHLDFYFGRYADASAGSWRIAARNVASAEAER